MVAPLLSLVPLAAQIIGAITGGGGGLGSILSSGADILKTLTGPDAERAAGKVVEVAKAYFGTDNVKDIELKIQQDRSLAERALAQIAAATEEFRIEVQDRADARERDLKVRAMNAGTNVRANVMLVGAFLVALVLIVMMARYGDSMKVEVIAAMNIALGAIFKMLGDAFMFEFGSSRSSNDKTVLLATRHNK